MDTNFQTSFIPKKPLAEGSAHVERHMSIYMFVATLVFFLALASAIGVYFYKVALTKSLAGMTASLTAARNSFEPALITQLQTLDRRMTDANQLLTHHIAVSPIFATLEANTLKSIQFTKFSYATPATPGSPVTILMSGKAQDYASIENESDQLATDKDISNPIFANLALDPTNGTVSFDLTFDVDASLVSYQNNLPVVSPSTPAPATTASTGTGTSGSTTTPSSTTTASTSDTTSTTPATTTTAPAGSGSPQS